MSKVDNSKWRKIVISIRACNDVDAEKYPAFAK